jgi:hypothetical protein
MTDDNIAKLRGKAREANISSLLVPDQPISA